MAFNTRGIEIQLTYVRYIGTCEKFTHEKRYSYEIPTNEQFPMNEFIDQISFAILNAV